MWTDSQIEPLKRIVDFCHAQGTLIGVQLTHGGRKTSTLAPWVHLNAAKTKRASTWVAGEEENGWPKGGTHVVICASYTVADVIKSQSMLPRLSRSLTTTLSRTL